MITILKESKSKLADYDNAELILRIANLRTS